jgi:hypothetical protein
MEEKKRGIINTLATMRTAQELNLEAHQSIALNILSFSLSQLSDIAKDENVTIDCITEEMLIKFVTQKSTININYA